MKIKNDFVKIDIGNKTYELRNMIFDNYIQYLINRSINGEEASKLMNFIIVYIKLDTPITGYTYSSELSKNNFDIYMTLRYEQELNQTNVVMNYTKTIGQYDDVNTINDTETTRELNYYNGRKICNIAFGFLPEYYEDIDQTNSRIGAILDTSNYDIYIQSNEVLSITRRDVISTDAIFASNNISKVPAPAHLAPYLLNTIINEEGVMYEHRCSGLLYSVSTSIDGKTIEDEYIVGTDVTVNVVGNSIEFSIIENKKNGHISYIGEQGNTYLGYSYLGMPTIKYFILKYKVMQLVYNSLEDTGYYYTLTVPIDKTGNLTFKINYERGE